VTLAASGVTLVEFARRRIGLGKVEGEEKLKLQSTLVEFDSAVKELRDVLGRQQLVPSDLNVAMSKLVRCRDELHALEGSQRVTRRSSLLRGPTRDNAFASLNSLQQELNRAIALLA
jgi:hypothetical protein